MADKRITSADAYEQYLIRTGKKSTMELIDAFFEGYKSGLVDGKDTVMAQLDIAIAENQTSPFRRD